MKQITTIESISKDVRLAFSLLKEMGYKYGDVDLNKAIIVTGYLSHISDFTELLGMSVYLCDMQSSYDYFICIPDATRMEQKWLKCHREAMQLS
jgi:hypothetical protein